MALKPIDPRGAFLFWVVLLVSSVGAPLSVAAQVQDGATMTVLRG